jgi:hypothetical protein
MVTVRIFFGAAVLGGVSGAAAAGAAGNGGGATGAAAATPVGATGMVEITRGANDLVGSFNSTGCSSRETTCSLGPALATRSTALPESALCPDGTTLVGVALALMIGGNDGSMAPPNMAR